MQLLLDSTICWTTWFVGLQHLLEISICSTICWTTVLLVYKIRLTTIFFRRIVKYNTRWYTRIVALQHYIPHQIASNSRVTICVTGSLCTCTPWSCLSTGLHHLPPVATLWQPTRGVRFTDNSRTRVVAGLFPLIWWRFARCWQTRAGKTARK